MTKSENKPKGPGGRPTKLTKDLLKKIAALYKKGSTNSIIASEIGVDRATYQQWIRKGREGTEDPLFQEFYNTYLKGDTDAMAFMEKMGLDNLLTKDKGSFNEPLWKFMMRTRWREDYTEATEQVVKSENVNYNMEREISEEEKIMLDRIINNTKEY